MKIPTKGYHLRIRNTLREALFDLERKLATVFLVPDDLIPLFTEAATAVAVFYDDDYFEDLNGYVIDLAESILTGDTVGEVNTPSPIKSMLKGVGVQFDDYPPNTIICFDSELDLCEDTLTYLNINLEVSLSCDIDELACDLARHVMEVLNEVELMSLDGFVDTVDDIERLVEHTGRPPKDFQLARSFNRLMVYLD